MVHKNVAVHFMLFRSGAILAALALFFVIVPSPLSAQTEKPLSLTMSQAVRIAGERNTQVIQAGYATDASQAAVLAAYGNLMPSLSVSGSWNRNQLDRKFTYIQNVGYLPIPSVPVSNSFSTGVSTGVTLFNGFANTAGVNEAVSSNLATQYSLDRTRQSVAYGVQGAYLNVLRTEQLVRVNAENLTRDSVSLVRSQEANRVGSVAVSDVYRWEVTVANDQVLLVQAQNNYAKAKADLLSLLSLDVTKEYVISDPSITSEIDTTEFAATNAHYTNFPTLYESAIEARPDYKGAVASVDAASSSVTMARGTYYPSVSFFASQGLNSQVLNIEALKANQSLFWGLQVQWNLFDRLQTNNRIQSAQASYRGAEEQLAQTQRTIQSDLKKGLLDLDAAEKSYIASIKGVRSAELDRKTAAEKYNLGAGTILDLTFANANYVQAMTNKINAVYTYIDAKNHLDLILGTTKY